MKQEIKTRAWVRVGNESVDVDTLSPEMRQELATRLALTYFNTLFAGRAVFSLAGEDTNEKDKLRVGAAGAGAVGAGVLRGNDAPGLNG